MAGLTLPFPLERPSQNTPAVRADGVDDSAFGTQSDYNAELDTRLQALERESVMYVRLNGAWTRQQGYAWLRDTANANSRTALAAYAHAYLTQQEWGAMADDARDNDTLYHITETRRTGLSINVIDDVAVFTRE